MSTTQASSSHSNQSKWLANYDQNIRTNRLWRHSFGRISCLARIPIYAIAVGLQTAKTLGKTAVSPITYLGVGTAWLFNLNSKPLDSWRFEGIAKDALMDLKLLDKIGSSAIGVMFAPPKKYYTLREALSSSSKIAVLGSHQDKTKGGKERTLKDIKKMTFLLRPDYSKLLRDQDRIVTSSENCFMFSRVWERVKAG